CMQALEFPPWTF
nr:immunoglobulin light chain junction region [Macaca mulatta]MOX97395.1 immunoglobulin light chain junction region [Macaca mulatta]MOX97642.1 immunoglobulin light chain junction region [Macaca mulatta]MOX97650.1 immunoglobulin light chain junction region [Macaca mulatta]MOX97788.1 immunoglobulin light chain junction region [Macaca mulatta]